MTTQHDKPKDPVQETGRDTVESHIVRRRKLLKRAAILGVPAMLTLHGKAFAWGTWSWRQKQDGGGDSGSLSGQLSGQQ